MESSSSSLPKKNYSTSYVDLGRSLTDGAIETVLRTLTSPENTSHAYYVISGTGTGKSTLIPPALLNFRIRRKDAAGNDIEVPPHIIVTVPTRIAVRSLYNTVSELRGKDGKPIIREGLVGYAAESEVVNKDAYLRYVTTEHFMRRMLKYVSTGKDLNCDILMIDEIHTGTIANEIILNLWMKIRDEEKKALPYLLLASANDVRIPIGSIPRGLVSSNPPFSIEQVYHYGDDELEKRFKITERKIYEEAGQVARYYASQDRGNILVFLPGRMEIEIARSIFDRAGIPNTFSIPIEGNVSRKRARQMNGMDEAEGKKLVIFATNAAETSLTIGNLGVVIDTLTEKIMYCAPDESSVLSTQWISLDSSLQRRGRTGRVRTGVYHVMKSKREYDKLNRGRPSEITRVPLSQYILLLTKNKLKGRDILAGAGNKRLEAAYKLVRDVGALNDKSDRELEEPRGSKTPKRSQISDDTEDTEDLEDDGSTRDEKLTNRGYFCSTLPLTVRVASFVYDVFEKAKEHRHISFDFVQALTLAGIIENFDSMYYVYDDRADRNEFFHAHFEKYVVAGSENSLQGRLLAWNDVVQTALSGFGYGEEVTNESCESAIIRVSEELHLEPYINRNIFRVLTMLRNRAHQAGIRVDGKITVDDVIEDVITNMMASNFPLYQRGTGSDKGFGRNPYYLSTSQEFDPYMCFQRGDMRHECVIALSTIRIQVGEDYTDKISMYTPFLSFGLRDNSAKARRSAKNTATKVNVKNVQDMSLEELFALNSADGSGGDDGVQIVKRKKKARNKDIINYVASLMISPSKKWVVTKETKSMVKGRYPYLPIRFEGISHVGNPVRPNIYNVLKAMAVGPVVVLDAHPLQVKPDMLFTSRYRAETYCGALCKTGELPEENMIFLLVDQPNKDMKDFLRERLMKTYSIFSSTDTSPYKTKDGFPVEGLYIYNYGVKPQPLKKEKPVKSSRPGEKKVPLKEGVQGGQEKRPKAKAKKSRKKTKTETQEGKISGTKIPEEDDEGVVVPAEEDDEGVDIPTEEEMKIEDLTQIPFVASGDGFTATIVPSFIPPSEFSSVSDESF